MINLCNLFCESLLTSDLLVRLNIVTLPLKCRHTHQPISFLCRYWNVTVGNPLVNWSAICSLVSIGTIFTNPFLTCFWAPIVLILIHSFLASISSSCNATETWVTDYKEKRDLSLRPQFSSRITIMRTGILLGILYVVTLGEHTVSYTSFFCNLQRSICLWS